jgi:hypothetical protein
MLLQRLNHFFRFGEEGLGIGDAEAGFQRRHRPDPVDPEKADRAAQAVPRWGCKPRIFWRETDGGIEGSRRFAF